MVPTFLVVLTLLTSSALAQKPPSRLPVSAQVVAGSPADAVRSLIDLVQNSSLPRNRVQPLVSDLKAATAALDRGNIRTAISRLQNFQNKVSNQLAPQVDVAVSQALIDAAQAIIDSLKHG
jgi:hypothetical protein